MKYFQAHSCPSYSTQSQICIKHGCTGGFRSGIAGIAKTAKMRFQTEIGTASEPQCSLESELLGPQKPLESELLEPLEPQLKKAGIAHA